MASVSEPSTPLLSPRRANLSVDELFALDAKGSPPKRQPLTEYVKLSITLDGDRPTLSLSIEERQPAAEPVAAPAAVPVAAPVAAPSLLGGAAVVLLVLLPYAILTATCANVMAADVTRFELVATTAVPLSTSFRLVPGANDDGLTTATAGEDKLRSMGCALYSSRGWVCPEPEPVAIPLPPAGALLKSPLGRGDDRFGRVARNLLTAFAVVCSLVLWLAVAYVKHEVPFESRKDGPLSPKRRTAEAAAALLRQFGNGDTADGGPGSPRSFSWETQDADEQAEEDLTIQPGDEIDSSFMNFAHCEPGFIHI